MSDTTPAAGSPTAVLLNQAANADYYDDTTAVLAAIDRLAARDRVTP